MSNTLNTPVEALELEFPLRVERSELLYGSGGEGMHSGGDGVVRQIRLLEQATLSLLTDRRRHAPRGVAGGGPGRPGRNLLNGEELPAKVTRGLRAGDVVTIETPGGGGWGGQARVTVSSAPFSARSRPAYNRSGMRVVGVDIGGTFTDFMLYDTESGAVYVHKVRSTPDDPGRARSRASSSFAATPGSRPPTSARSSTGRPSRRTRCSSTVAQRRAW